MFEVDLVQRWHPAELWPRLGRLAPPGLDNVARPKWCRRARARPQAKPLYYELPLPAGSAGPAASPSRRAGCGPPKAGWPSASRPRQAGRSAGDLDELTVERGMLRMKLRATRTAQARPRDILAVLEFGGLEISGSLVRTRVELEP